MTQYQNLDDLKHEGLRDEAKGWEADGHPIYCGEAVLVPNDGSGPMYGFFDATQNKGMVAWGLKDDDDTSDWIDASTLQEVFQKYVENMD